MYLIIYENTFCILYDRCLYACWIDRFFLFSILDSSRGSRCCPNGFGMLSVPVSELLHKKSAQNVTVTLLRETFCTQKRPQPTMQAGIVSPKAAENGV